MNIDQGGVQADAAPGQDGPAAPCKLIREGHRGYDVFLSGYRYIAVPQGEKPGDPGDGWQGGLAPPVDSGDGWQGGLAPPCVGQATDDRLIGLSLAEVLQEIDALEARGPGDGGALVRPGEKVLLLCSTEPMAFNEVIERLDHADLTLLIPRALAGVWKDRNAIIVEQGGLASLSDADVHQLRSMGFDLVVVPYDRENFWATSEIDRLATRICSRIITVSPGGELRLFKGEDFLRNVYNKPYLWKMLHLIPGIEGQRVLEVGCSDGLACHLLLNEGPRQVVGVDVIDSVGCSFPDPAIEYHKLDASRMDCFEDDSFDVCFSIATMEHCQDPLAVMREMTRVTRPGGHCFIQAAPLYCSPFGHHMFGFFDDVPWIHLRWTREEIMAYAAERGVDNAIEDKYGFTVGEYLDSMLCKSHVNMKKLSGYEIGRFLAGSDVDLLHFNRTYEGKELVAGVAEELSGHREIDLVTHGFELAFAVGSQEVC